VCAFSVGKDGEMTFWEFIIALAEKHPLMVGFSVFGVFVVVIILIVAVYEYLLNSKELRVAEKHGWPKGYKPMSERKSPVTEVFDA
jgi:uncharacterized membrane protein